MSPSIDLERPTMPATYVVQWVAFLERRGIAAADMLRDTKLDLVALGAPDARVSPLAFVQLLFNSFPLAQDPALGYAFGLELRPTSHGFLGYALLTCDTLRDAIRLGERFSRLRTEAARLRFFVEGDTAVIELEEAVALGPLRQFALEGITAAILRIAHSLLGAMPENSEIWVDYPEPSHYEAWRDRLPPVRFNRPANQLRFAAAELERPLVLADANASRIAVAQLERELALFGAGDDTVARVEALMRDPAAGFPDLEASATRLFMSSRTLKRRLRAQGRSFQQLLDDARLARATVLLEDRGVSVEQIASELGYADPANFTRAFKRWTGKAPTAFRKK
jgi:AraC-like DNA-binding protein